MSKQLLGRIEKLEAAAPRNWQKWLDGGGDIKTLNREEQGELLMHLENNLDEDYGAGMGKRLIAFLRGAGPEVRDEVIAGNTPAELQAILDQQQ